MFKRLLIPLDGSRFGSRAIKYGSEVAQKFGAEVIVFQVVKPAIPPATTTGMAPVIGSPSTTEIATQAALEEDKRNISNAKRYLSRKVREIDSQNIRVSYQVVVGDPAQSIMEFAEKENIDLVVMATHGRSGLKRAIMGSVADKVVRESGKPVLVVRP